MTKLTSHWCLLFFLPAEGAVGVLTSTPQVAIWRLREAQRPSGSWPVQPQILCKWRGCEDRVGSPVGCPGGGGWNSTGLGNAAGCPEWVALCGTRRTEGIRQGLHKASGGEAGAARSRRIRAGAQPGPEDGGGRLGGAAGSHAPGGGPVPCSAGGRGPPTALGAMSVAETAQSGLEGREWGQKTRRMIRTSAEKVSASWVLSRVCQVASAAPPPCGSPVRTEVLAALRGVPRPGPWAENGACLTAH